MSAKSKSHPRQVTPDVRLSEAIELLNTLRVSRYLSVYVRIGDLNTRLEQTIAAVKEHLQHHTLTVSYCQELAQKMDLQLIGLGNLTAAMDKEKDFLQTHYYDKSSLQEKIWCIIESTKDAAALGDMLTALAGQLLQGHTVFSLTAELTTLKEKTWQLLEAVDNYCTDKFNISVW